MAVEHKFDIIQREVDGTYLYVVDGNLEEIREFEEEVHSSFEKLSEKHIKAAGGLLSLLPYDPETYPFQRLDVVETRIPERASMEVLESFAELAYPEYPKLKDQFMVPKNDRAFESMLRDIGSGQDFALLFDHGRIINTPLGKIAAIARLEATAKAADQNVPDYIARITISKLLSRFKAMGLPAVNVLAQFGVVGMSLPPSETVRNVIPKPVRDGLNRSFKSIRQHPETESIESGNKDDVNYRIKDVREKPVLDSFSGSGTTDVPVSGLLHKRQKDTVVHMGPISRGTPDLLQSSKVLPISVNVNQSDPTTAVGVVHNPPRNKAEADTLMVEVSHLAREASGLVHRYHPTREDFQQATVRKRLLDIHRSDRE